MAASSADFKWYHDADDEHPIGHTEALTAAANSSTSPLHSSAGPSNRVQQLRGQPKVVIKSASTKVVVNTRRTNPRKRRHSDDHNSTTRPPRKTTAAQGKGKGKKVAAIAIDSKPEMDETISADDDSSDDIDLDDLSVQDKSVSPCCFIQLSTDTIYYRSASVVTMSVAKTSAVLMSILCLRRGNLLKVAKR